MTRALRVSLWQLCWILALGGIACADGHIGVGEASCEPACQADQGCDPASHACVCQNTCAVVGSVCDSAGSGRMAVCTLNAASGCYSLGPLTACPSSGQSCPAGGTACVTQGSDLQIGTTALPPGAVGTAYSATLAASGGTPPYAWSKASGSLPEGLALATNGTISGTPTTADTTTFLVQVQDAASATSAASLSITISATAPAPTDFSVSSPANGATVSGTIQVTGVAGSQWLNVAAFALTGTTINWSQKLSADTAPAGGAFSLSLDTTQLADGTVPIAVVAFSTPPGQSGGTTTSVNLTLSVDNSGGAVNGACGSANGVGTSAAPTTGLCSAGTASAVSGSGPWTWSCAGSNGGTTASCSAPLASTTTPQPMGVPGTWTLVFDDEFDGTSLDTSKWTTMDGGGWGSTTCRTANVSVSGGNLVLTLASSSSGACVCTGSACAPAFGGYFSAGSGSYDLPVGGYTEARVSFPGSGTNIYNWPAWWTSGPGWPAGGEHDIAEGCGTLTENYHSSSGAHNHGTISGTWSNAFHVYGLHRKASSVDVYYDGQVVISYATDDDGSPQSLLVDLMDGYGQAVYGAGSRVLVDYVRAWQ
jgi:hypothetical protein